ncbi:Inherit from NOG: ring finger protein 8, E3 ubiquitin protein ligase [Seminavis robusta]|uniref:Inherit from NOG: ring finger protein 8, E3 ubiquitin protein ligase n=1 Tax=Seminavis robusta TaxID=568900 RepID=A0A9N8H8E3_9STRA|nr:Inherit from NOG: ring finger protein 8, E3 ubiquitin protein ligase [Seminavis robusta]|eukprot:Sro157_g071230.1 Inherit from NOG: ring finger protein 8, E3 ubiquitin protein ligase (1063) ;mRNA; r:61507-64773
MAKPKSSDDNDMSSLGSLFYTLQDELTNMGRALVCPLCLSSYRDAVVLPCVHAYCRSCIQQALRQGQSRCPTCLTKATKRSMAPAPILNQLTKAYKVALRHFGLAPVQFDPSYNAMTQIAPGEMTAESSLLTMEPLQRRNQGLVASHTQLLVSRTWKKVLKESQQQQARKSKPNEKPKQNNSSKLPAHIPTQGRIHEWYQQQQDSVIASHERALIDAAKDRQPPTLSMQEQISMEEALEEDVANQQAELEEQWLQEEEERKQKEQQKQKRKESKEEDDDEDHTRKQHQETKNSAQQEQEGSPCDRPSHNNQDDSSPSTSDGQARDVPQENNEDDNDASKPVDLSFAYSQRTVLGAHSLFGFAQQAEAATPGTVAAETSPEQFPTDDGEDDNADNGAATTGAAVAQEQVTIGAQNERGSAASSATTGNAIAGAMDEEGGSEPPVEQKQSMSPTAARGTGSRPPEELDRTRDNDRVDEDGPEPPAEQQQSMSPTVARGTGSNRNGSNQPSNSNSAGNNDENNNQSERTERQEISAAVAFKVGEIVQVRSRTWPGVNKPGGIAKISKVVDGSYHIQYILGGKEKNVDAVFLSRPPEEMDWTGGNDRIDAPADSLDVSTNGDETVAAISQRERKSRRISTKRRDVKVKHERKVQEQSAILPPDLMKQLAAEGFDVAPMTAEQATTVPRGSGSARRKQSTAQAVVVPAKRKSTTQHPPSNKRGSAQRKKALTVTSKARQDEKDSQVKNRSTARTSKGRAPKKQKAGPEVSAPVQSLPSSNRDVCRLADEKYAVKFQNGLDNCLISVIASGLSDDDKASLKALISEAKGFGNVRIKQSDAFRAKNTTLCIVPAASKDDDDENLVGNGRTLKGMRCMLAGIPLVSPSWIALCRNQGQITMPLASMLVRSLPVKVEAVRRCGVADYAVAKMAARYDGMRLLEKFTVHLLGRFDRPPKEDVLLLLNESGARVSTQMTSTVACLERCKSGSSDESLVLLCDDNCSTFSDSLYRPLKAAIERGGEAKQKVLIVNFNWLFDSIAAGSALSSDAYGPMQKKGRPFGLWRLLHPQS